jgi:SAM-dependent methyltransferase
VLHVGCGGDPLPAFFGTEPQETRLDIDETYAPDIVGSMVDLGDIGPFDAIYSSHSLEHLYPHDVDTALGEFYRVLTPGGKVLVIVPDLEGVTADLRVLYESPAGPICGRDMVYGKTSMLKDSPYMAHKTGFVKATLERALREAGFSIALGIRANDYQLVAIGIKGAE